MVIKTHESTGISSLAASTNHLSVRCQQRGVKEQDLQTIIGYGRRERWFHGALLYYMGRRELKWASINEPALKRSADRLEGLAVVVCGTSGRMLTTFKSKRGIHEISRNYGSQKKKSMMRQASVLRSF